jgi:hypothetical protein
MSDEAGTLSDYTSDDEIDMMKLQSIKFDKPKTEGLAPRPTPPAYDSQIFS